MTLAIEPMITAGGPEVYVHDDEWSISSSTSRSRPISSTRWPSRPTGPDSDEGRSRFATMIDRQSGFAVRG